MEGLGDYIYLLVILVAGLSSLLKKRKKQSGDYSESELPDMDDVLPEYDVFEETEPQFRPVYTQPTTSDPVSTASKYSTPITTENSMQSRSKPIYESVRDAKLMQSRNLKKSTPISEIEAFKQVDEVPDTFVESIQFETVEDAKRAFVYAEIFNRKY